MRQPRVMRKAQGKVERLTDAATESDAEDTSEGRKAH